MRLQRMQRRQAVLFMLLVLTHVPRILPAQQPATAPRINVNVAEITLNGRVQTQVNTTSVETLQDAEIILRRVRLGATVRMNDLVGGRVHVDFAGNAVAIADAYLQLTLSPAVQIWAGRAYRPFAIMEQTTSLQIVPIERGLAIRGVQDFDLSAILNSLRYGDRDIGLQLRGAPTGAPLGLSYAAAITAGPVHGATGGQQTQQFVARLMAAPIPRTRVGIAWNRRDFVRQPVPEIFEVEPGDAFVVDLEYGAPNPTPQGVHLVAEAVTGVFDPFADEDFRGAQVWLGYGVVMEGQPLVIEPLIRVSHASIDRVSPTAPEGGLVVTPGLNLHLGGLNRLMFNYDFWRPGLGSRASSFKAQFQMAF